MNNSLIWRGFMTCIKYFLLMAILLTHTVALTVHAQDDLIPESDTSSGSFIPPVNSTPAMPPTIIDDSDSSGVSDPDDNDN